MWKALKGSARRKAEFNDRFNDTESLVKACAGQLEDQEVRIRVIEELRDAGILG